MTPVVKGETHHFAARGIYNGMLLLGDHESNSYWNYITGECVHGPLKGYQLQTFPLLHMTVSQALATDAGAQLAIPNSWLPAYLRFCYRMYVKRRLPPFLRKRMDNRLLWLLKTDVMKTLGEEDPRRPFEDMGLGVWSDALHRFYPLERLRAHGGTLIDELDGRQLLIYIEPNSGVPTASYTEATQCIWQADALHLNTGEVVRGGALYDPHGVLQTVAEPMQLFTRWYGFASTFPGCEVYEG